MADGRHFENRYIAISSTDFDEIWQITVSVYLLVQHALMHT